MLDRFPKHVSLVVVRERNIVCREGIKARSIDKWVTKRRILLHVVGKKWADLPNDLLLYNSLLVSIHYLRHFLPEWLAFVAQHVEGGRKVGSHLVGKAIFDDLVVIAHDGL